MLNYIYFGDLQDGVFVDLLESNWIKITKYVVKEPTIYKIKNVILGWAHHKYLYSYLIRTAVISVKSKFNIPHAIRLLWDFSCNICKEKLFIWNNKKYIVKSILWFLYYYTDASILSEFLFALTGILYNTGTISDF